MTSPRETVGPFPSWRWVYGIVVAYGILVILVLALLTVFLNPGPT